MPKLAWVSMLLATAAAVVYILAGLGVLRVPGLTENPPPAIPYVCAACYILGGLLVLVGNRWLLILGSGINVMVIGIFFAMYNQNSDVIFSFPGLFTKMAQVLLEIGLIALIVSKSPQALQNWKSRS
jgi:hypothetical protein